MKTIDRRDFLKQLGLVVGGAMLLPACDFARVVPDPGFRSLSSGTASCLGAMCDVIIPSDDWPGAVEAGVLNYIDKQTTLRFPQDKASYKNGVASLQSYCRDAFGENFEELVGDIQYKIMQDMEAGRLPERYWKELEQKKFFELVRVRTMQGFYGPAKHGGNKDFVSYRMMRLDHPLVVGQNRYRS